MSILYVWGQHIEHKYKIYKRWSYKRNVIIREVQLQLEDKKHTRRRVNLSLSPTPE